MRAACCAALLALPLVGGCEMLEETYLVEQDVIVDQQGVRVTSDLEEDLFGASWFQFRAYNSNPFPVCVRVTLDGNSYTSGHSLGGAYPIGAGASVDVGYINNPSDFYVNTYVYNLEDDGTC